MRGQHPRGWAPGDTWDIVAGVFSGGRGIMGLGSGQGASVGTVAAHELGHAVGFYGRLDEEKFAPHHIRLFAKFSPYCQQDGPGSSAGCGEAFAEVFSLFLTSGKDAVSKRWDAEMADWIEAQVGALK